MRLVRMLTRSNKLSNSIARLDRSISSEVSFRYNSGVCSEATAFREALVCMLCKPRLGIEFLMNVFHGGQMKNDS